MHLDQILPGFFWTSQMSTIFPQMYFELFCILMYHAMLNSENHNIFRHGLVRYDPSYLSESSSCDDQALAEPVEKGS